MSDIKKLAELNGITEQYTDKTGKIHYTPEGVRQKFLQAMGCPCENEEDILSSLAQIERETWCSGLDSVTSFYADESAFPVSLRLKEEELKAPIALSLTDESGFRREQSLTFDEQDVLETKIIDGQKYVLLHVMLPNDIAVGYHDICITTPSQTYRAMIIMAPPKCYLTADIEQEKLRVYGLSVQLYAMRSRQNMGIGDFTDLKELIRLTSQNGCDVIGLNPLGITFPENIGDVSPYRPLSRQYLSYLYVDLRAAPEFQQSPEIAALVATPEYQQELEQLRSSDKVDYYHLFKFKTRLLKLMYQHFLTHEALSERGKNFAEYVEAKGQNLRNTCLFEALLAHNSPDNLTVDWRIWPNGYADINSAATQRFAAEHEEEISFYAYCHWLADCQLAEAAQLCEELGMKIGLYLDSPIGAASSGVEVWQQREVFAQDMIIGAPADPMRPRGQSWGFAPYHPRKLKKAFYQPFIKQIRENMHHAKALRIDHAMGLMRLFWGYFTPDNPVVQGTYVYYTIKDLVAILCIESNRYKCLVIGEDLGTVPEGFREYMYEHGLLSNKVFFRQKGKDGSFLAPDKYQYLSLAQASTHDQATAYGYWLNEDIRSFNNCSLYVNDEQFRNNLDIRAAERRLLLEAFLKQNTFINHEAYLDTVAKLSGQEIPQFLEYAINQYVARTNSAIFLLRTEDIYGQVLMENVPGTIDEYPNWQYKLKIDIEDMEKDGRLGKLFALIRRERP